MNAAWLNIIVELEKRVTDLTERVEDLEAYRRIQEEKDRQEMFDDLDRQDAQWYREVNDLE